MGSDMSLLVAAEKLNWVKHHSLEIDTALQAQQRPLLRHFGSTVFLCSQERSMMGCPYYHHFVTDHIWTIEFGGGETLNCCVQVHNNPMGTYQQECAAANTDDIMARMQRVCGARGYSLCLRNCEHLARYVISGSWVSSQTLLTSRRVGARFAQYMMQEQKAILNTPPIELVDPTNVSVLYPSQKGFLAYEGSPVALNYRDRDAFNVLVIGPTGCGKSHLINLMYNQTVCHSAGSAESVTKSIHITTGSGTVESCRRKVNVIDTIGLCDSKMSSSEVLGLIKEKVSQNFMYIDRVVVICSGRIEAVHSDAIKQILKWLRYGTFTYQANFTFVYNKADQLRPEERERCLMQMCQLLEVSSCHIRGMIPNENIPSNVLANRNINKHFSDVVVPLKIACGFPPDGSYNSIEADLHKLLDNVFTSSMQDGRVTRIPAEEAWCSIL